MKSFLKAIRGLIYKLAPHLGQAVTDE